MCMQLRRPALQRPERLALALLIIVTLLSLVPGCTPAAQPKPELRLVASLDLADGPYDNLVLARLRLSESVVLRLHLRLSELDTPFFDLALHDATQHRYRIMQAADYRTDRDGGALWEQEFPAGEYQIVLTAAQSPGTLAVLMEPDAGVQLEAAPPVTAATSPLSAARVTAFFSRSTRSRQQAVPVLRLATWPASCSLTSSLAHIATSACSASPAPT